MGGRERGPGGEGSCRGFDRWRGSARVSELDEKISYSRTASSASANSATSHPRKPHVIGTGPLHRKVQPLPSAPIPGPKRSRDLPDLGGPIAAGSRVLPRIAVGSPPKALFFPENTFRPTPEALFFPELVKFPTDNAEIFPELEHCH